MNHAPTLDDVAAKSGCSPATVSLALRNKPGVSRATRERVLAAAQSLGYQRVQRPSIDADEPRLNVAVIFRTWRYDRTSQTPNITDFHSWVLTGLQESAVAQGANLLLDTIPVDELNQCSDFPERLLRQKLDGIVLVGSFRPEVVNRVRMLAETYRPAMVLVDEHDSASRTDSIETANREGSYDATRYLLRKGHRRLAFFGPTSEWEPNYRERKLGFLQALEETGLSPVGIFEEMIKPVQTQNAARDVLKAADEATAFVCSNDLSATALLRACLELGIDVPGSISVIGFDDIDRARIAHPPLTTMAVDKLGLGRHAMYALMNRMQWPESPPMQILLRPSLVERQSVRDLRAETGAGANVPEPELAATGPNQGDTNG